MEQLDVVILTLLIIIAFLVFIVATLKEFRNMDKNPFDGQTTRRISKKLK